MNLFLIAIFSEWLCLLTAIFLLKSKVWKHYLILIPYLSYIVIIETFGNQITKIADGFSNHVFYNILTLFDFFIASVIFYQILYSKNARITIIILAFLFLLIFTIELTIKKSIFNYLSFSTTIYSVFIIILSLIYYTYLFLAEEYVNLKSDTAFWFVTGLFMFHSISIGTNTFFDFLVVSKEKFNIRTMVLVILSVILYSCWIRAFLCLPKKILPNKI